MTNGEIVGLVALILNIITLFIVIYQTRLSRKSFQISEISFKENNKVREMSIVPKMHFVIHVKIQIEKWIENIKNIREEMELAVKDNNDKALKQISKRGLKSCKGLVDKFYYEKSPDWLAEIYMASAKYYYSAYAPISNLWDEKENKGRLYALVKNSEYSETLIDRCNETEMQLTKLLGYINNVIPNVLMEVPESISDDKYLNDNK